MRKFHSTVSLLALCFTALLLASCHRSVRDSRTLVFLIESSPTSLDPRIGTDAQSEHIDELLFDGLVARDTSFRFVPALAESWQQTDPLTLVFHLRHGVRFHNGAALTSRDVISTIDSMRLGKIISPKGASYASVDHLDAPDDFTVIFHLKRPDNFLLTNLSTGAMGIVPANSDKNFWRHPIGTGPFRFVSQQMDQNVVVERNPAAWQHAPAIERIRFSVVPDAITAVLELQKGSADVAVNFLPMDALPELARNPRLQVSSVAGTQIQYLGFNLRDPLLKDVRVRQAISCAIDRNLIIRTLQRGHGSVAESMLPASHWAFNSNVERYDYDPARARRLLDAAGFHADASGTRLSLTMKTSTDEGTRLLAAVLQQQLASVGVRLEIRSYEYATFYSDVTRGAFQLYSLRWIGGNEQPDIFSYAFSTARFSPKGANRGHYSNPQLDALLDDAAASADQSARKRDYDAAQRILAHDLPAINLWYRDSVVVHSRRLQNLLPNPSGSFAFLESATLAP